MRHRGPCGPRVLKPGRRFERSTLPSRRLRGVSGMTGGSNGDARARRLAAATGKHRFQIILVPGGAGRSRTIVLGRWQLLFGLLGLACSPRSARAPSPTSPCTRRRSRRTRRCRTCCSRRAPTRPLPRRARPAGASTHWHRRSALQARTSLLDLRGERIAMLAGLAPAELARQRPGARRRAAGNGVGGLLARFDPATARADLGSIDNRADCLESWSRACSTSACAGACCPPRPGGRSAHRLGLRNALRSVHRRAGASRRPGFRRRRGHADQGRRRGHRDLRRSPAGVRQHGGNRSRNGFVSRSRIARASMSRKANS